MNFTIKELEMECRFEKIELTEKDLIEKPVKKTLIRKLQEYYLPSREDSWGLRERLKIESPMLCWGWKNLKEYEKEEILENDGYVAEEKLNGVRAIVTYHKDEGIRIFSRHLSAKDFLPVEYTKNVPILMNTGNYLFASDLQIPNITSFVFDCEITSTKHNVTINKETTNSQLNAVVALLNADWEKAWDVTVNQKQTDLHINVFDILSSDGENFQNAAWYWRRKERIKILGKMLDISTFKHVKSYRDILSFYKKITSEQRGEGVVIKDITASYVSTENRTHRSWIKMKRSMMESLVTDIDAFIIGFEEATKGKGREEFIGSLKLGVFVGDTVHHIATVSGMSDEMRKEMTEKIFIKYGYVPSLKREYLNKVLTIDGMSISPKTKRLTHARIDWDRGFREDKTANDCRLSWKEIENHIM